MVGPLLCISIIIYSIKCERNSDSEEIVTLYCGDFETSINTKYNLICGYVYR